MCRNNNKTNLKPIELIQKKAIRIINNVGYTHPTNELFHRLGTLKFKNIVELYTAQIVYKARYNLLPGNLQILYRNRDGRYEYRNPLNFQQPRTRTEWKRLCVSAIGVKLWNDLPDELKKCNNIYQFKKMFKKRVIDNYGLSDDD